nr:hypothetical protein CVNMHQAP_CVNMHQAP_CDS_0113 [uncultured phage]
MNIQTETITDLYSKFENSVAELSSKLPQWNSEDTDKVILSAVSSLFEEAGELCGLVSKYRIRKHYYKTKPSELENFDEIRTKFIDESGDLLWVMSCTEQNLIKKDKIKPILFTQNEDYNLSLEVALFDIIRDKYRIRKHYYKTKPSELENFDEIRTKFIDESGDLLWVMSCTEQNLIKKDKIKPILFTQNEDYNLSLEVALFDIIRDISIMRQSLLFNNNKISTATLTDFDYLVRSYKTYLKILKEEYNIELVDILIHNMNKLNARYASDGSRTDGK